jgi:hypothetical protein
LRPANEICEEIRAIEEERARADNDAAFELACRIIVMKSLPAWIDEICAEQCVRCRRAAPARQAPGF